MATSQGGGDKVKEVGTNSRMWRQSQGGGDKVKEVGTQACIETLGHKKM